MDTTSTKSEGVSDCKLVPMRGITAWGTYLPFRRLDRSTIAAVAGKGGGRGTRTVASFDEDSTTMAVEASRRALRSGPMPDTVLLGSVLPAFADKTNATTLHAVLRLPSSTASFDLGSSARSAVGGLLLAGNGAGTTLVAAADIRGGMAGSAEEASGGDAAAAVLIGDDTSSQPVLAEIVSTASVSAEFIDRWRAPGDAHSKIWDEKFSTVTSLPHAQEALAAALDQAGLKPEDITRAAIAAPFARLAKTAGGKLGLPLIIDDLSASVGQTGAAQPALLLASLLEQSEAGDQVALVSIQDGADVIILRATDALSAYASQTSIASQVDSGAPVSYGKFLTWRGVLEVEPPRRPEPQRVSATAAARSDEWKFGFVASTDPTSGAVHLPPIRVSADGERVDEMADRPMADVGGTIVTFTIDHVAYSPSPPIVFAVVDFDGGGRLPIELCDCDADEVSIGGRVEMTFRRLHAIDGIPNYFWKARLVRG